MPRTLLILGLLVLALGAAMTVLLWRPTESAPHTVPMALLFPATAIAKDTAEPADGVASLGVVAADLQPAVTRAGTAVLVREAPAPAGEPEPTETLLQVELLDDQKQPVLHHELVLLPLTNRRKDGAIVAAPRASLRQRSDATGQLRFALPRTADESPLRIALHSASLGWIEAELPAKPRLQLTLQLQPRCWVQGVVLGADGSPVPDATLVHVLPDAAEHSSAANRGATSGLPRAGSTAQRAPRELGRSDRLGRFRIALVHSGLLGAEHAELAPSALQPVAVPGRDEPVRNLELRLQLLTVQGRIAGTARAADGKPLAGVRLQFRSGEATASRLPRRPPQVTSSDDDGRFEVANLVPGEVCWSAQAPGHGGTRGQLVVPPGQTAELQVSLPLPASMHGSVRTADGKAVAGARLLALPAASQPTTNWCDEALASTTVSAADGSYELADLPPGMLRITADGPDQQPGTATATWELQPGQRQAWQAVLAAPSARPWLRGQVLDAAYQASPGRTVVLLQEGASPQLTRTDADGRFQFELPSVAAARLSVLAEGAGMQSFDLARLQVPTPAMAEVQLVLDAEVDRIRLLGFVQSHDHQPLPATVSLWHQGLQRTARVTAGVEGRFELEAVPVGQIEVTIAHPGHATRGPFPLELRSGSDVDLGTITLGQAGALHGSVLAADGQPPGELEVFVITSDDALVPGEYAGGQYRIDRLPAGNHWLHVQGPQVAAASFAIEIQAGVELQRDMRLLAGVRRSFVIEADAAAGNRLSLVLRKPGERGQWLAQSTRSADGNATFVAWLAPGSYEALAFSSDGWQTTSKVTMTAGDESTVRLRLRRP